MPYKTFNQAGMITAGILAVNKKISSLKRLEQELIEKRRTEFDKRSFEYFIDTARLAEALKIIREHGASTGS